MRAGEPPVLPKICLIHPLRRAVPWRLNQTLDVVEYDRSRKSETSSSDLNELEFLQRALYGHIADLAQPARVVLVGQHIGLFR